MVFFVFFPTFAISKSVLVMEKKEKEKPLNEVADERRHTEAMEYTKGLLERMTQDEQLVQALEQRIERVFDKKMQEWMQQVNEKKGE